jgi:hypothetical protein
MHSLLNVLLELKISMTYYLTQTNDKVCKDLLITNNEKDKKSLHRTNFFFVQIRLKLKIGLSL